MNALVIHTVLLYIWITSKYTGPNDVFACIKPKSESWNLLYLASRKQIQMSLSKPNLVRGLSAT